MASPEPCVCSPSRARCEIPPWTASSPVLWELCSPPVTALPSAQAASSPDPTNQFICTGEKKAQYCNPPGGAFYYLTQKFILSAFQEPLGLPTALHATFLPDVWVVEVPEKDECLRLWHLL